MNNNPTKIVLLTAVADELGAENIAKLNQLCDVKLIGVGKLNSFEATLNALADSGKMGTTYSHIINVGSCGSFCHTPGTLLYPSIVAQGDIYIASDFATPPISLGTGNEGCSIVSSDNFIGADTPPSQLELFKPFDAMDMESYAIMRAIAFYSARHNQPQPEVHMIKIVSDAADGTLEEWAERIKQLQTSLYEATQATIDQINTQHNQK